PGLASLEDVDLGLGERRNRHVLATIAVEIPRENRRATESLVAHEYDRGLRGREVGRAEVGEDLVPVDGRNEKVGEAVAVQITGTVVPEPEGLLRFVRRLEHRHVELRPYGRRDRDDVARIARAIDGSNREVVVVLDEQVADV